MEKGKNKPQRKENTKNEKQYSKESCKQTMVMFMFTDLGHVWY
jgi:hypothetical protein